MENIRKNAYYSGLSGLQLNVPKYLYPTAFENASRLTYYASFFNSIEFNSSFYKIPQSGTVSRWSSSVPENFKFTFKLWKGITHNKGLLFNKEDLFSFFKAINFVMDKKGCLLLQFPPSAGIQYTEQLEQLLTEINAIDGDQNWRVAIEFRNNSWYHQDVYELLNVHGAALVIHDIPKSATPLIPSKVDFIYLRFHGPTGNYRDSYSGDFISEYATYIKEWMGSGKVVFTYFNNTMGEAFNNLLTLNELISENMLECEM